MALWQRRGAACLSPATPAPASRAPQASQPGPWGSWLHLAPSAVTTIVRAILSAQPGRGQGLSGDPAGEKPRQQPHSRGPRALGVSQGTRPLAKVRLQQNKPPRAPGEMYQQGLQPPPRWTPLSMVEGLSTTPSPQSAPAPHTSPWDTAKPRLQRKFTVSPRVWAGRKPSTPLTPAAPAAPQGCEDKSQPGTAQAPTKP